MKKITKLLVVTALLAAMFAMPVMAKDVSFASDNTDYLIVLLNNNAAKLNADLNIFISKQCGPNADAVIAAQKALVADKIVKVNKECAENHIDNLSKKLYNAQQLEAARLKQLNQFKTFASQAAGWDAELASSQKDYDNAVAARIAAETYLADAKVKLAPFM